MIASMPPVLLPPSEQVCAELSKQYGGTCVLAFSCGKDSIGAWLQLRRFFSNIIPFHCSIVLGLDFIERSLVQYELFFGTKIVRLVDPGFFDMIDRLAWQPPERWDALSDLKIYRSLNNRDIDDWMRESSGLPIDAPIAHGWRINDSPPRRKQMRKVGAVWRGRGWFFPVWDWTDNRLEQELERECCPLPVDYRLFGRSFESIKHRFLEPIRKEFPDDYRRILALFPMAKLDSFRRLI